MNGIMHLHTTHVSFILYFSYILVSFISLVGFFFGMCSQHTVSMPVCLI